MACLPLDCSISEQTYFAQQSLKEGSLKSTCSQYDIGENFSLTCFLYTCSGYIYVYPLALCLVVNFFPIQYKIIYIKKKKESTKYVSTKPVHLSVFILPYSPVLIKRFQMASLNLCLFYDAGRFEDSQVLSELVYLASNLLVLLNDTIFRQTAKVLKNIVSDTFDKF